MLLTIGLEIHIKLKSINKMFCQCKNEQNFDNLLPNTNICPVCTAQPGALPTLSEEVLEKALLLGKALNCKINEISTFDRKSYFYPDQPSGYQITQFYHPTNTEGHVSFFLDNYTTEKTIHIHDAHMENDTGKMIHAEGQAMLDFNRSGTPLVEIVTNPDFSTTEEVVEFLKELQRLVRFNDIADADLEKGQMRVDVNISVRNSEADPLGTRAEIKNINSFGMIKRAIEQEQARQEKIYAAGETFSQQTRGRDDAKGESYLMRSKEDALDYRYFPEPDMPALKIDEARRNRLDTQIITVPHNIIKQFKEYGFNKEYINALISDKAVLDYLNFILSSFIKGEASKTEGFKEADFVKLTAKRIS
ncbi:TPA: Asp-tRNA(Asn)/Glu-tRNA(Gln) amidotransferase GatCAB subunit B [Patescibacteria group bacterium]|nr:Asp-tRNA(Asn)/Glu-tRNA(Gln) amidotransferase GatCAB subunit B [Candidatus Gracilibacteria bacterium]